MKMNWYKTLLAGFLSAILTSTVLSAESKWSTEPAAKSALQEIDTAFGKGFRLHAPFSGSLRAVKKLDAAQYAGKKVVLDAQFKFICQKNTSTLRNFLKDHLLNVRTITFLYLTDNISYFVAHVNIFNFRV